MCFRQIQFERKGYQVGTYHHRSVLGTAPLTGEKGERLEHCDGSVHAVCMQTPTSEPMEPSEQFCPNPMCCASGHKGQDNIIIHDRKQNRTQTGVEIVALEVRFLDQKPKPGSEPQAEQPSAEIAADEQAA